MKEILSQIESTMKLETAMNGQEAIDRVNEWIARRAQDS